MDPDYLSTLPPPLLISRMSYLPFDDVVSLCTTNAKLHNICSSDRYANEWKALIDDTYGNTQYYKDLAKKDIKYN